MLNRIHVLFCVGFLACHPPTETSQQSVSPFATPSAQVTTRDNGVLSLFDRIGVRSVHAEGLTGQGVIAALMDDTGINFNDPELQGKEVLGSLVNINFMNPTAIVRYADGAIRGQLRGNRIIPLPLFSSILEHQGLILVGSQEPYAIANAYSGHGTHGTEMAKIFAGSLNNIGSRGVAPSTRLIPYRHWRSVIASLVHAVSLSARIACMSFYEGGIDSMQIQGAGEANEFNHEDELSHSVLQNILMVKNAGDHGSVANSTSLESGHTAFFDTDYGNVIVTVAVDESNRLTSVSNRCGNTQRFCIAVPSMGPTSPTAPIVSGSAALLMEALPGRPIRDYAHAILETATPLGPPEETGRGLLNVDAALRYLRAH